MKDMIMKPKIWLIILAVMHTLMGVIATYIIVGNADNLASIIQLGFISIYLLYVAFMTEGQAQARLATVLCAPFIVWFIISGALMPLTLWGLPTITGILNWNTD